MKKKLFFICFTLISICLVCLLLSSCKTGSSGTQTGEKATAGSVAAESTDGAVSSPTVSGNTTSVPENSPVVTEATPAATEAATVVPETTPVVPETTAVAPDNTPVAPDNTPVAPDNTPVAPEHESYGEWVVWRNNNPEKYAEWKLLPMPETFEERIIEKERDNEYYWYYLYDEYNDRFWIDFFSPLAQEHKRGTPLSAPAYLDALKNGNITKEELLEYTKWERMYHNRSTLTVDEIDLLFSGDTEKIRQHFKMPCIMFTSGDLIFTRQEVWQYVSPFDIGRMFTPEEFGQFMKQFSEVYHPEESGRLSGTFPWDEYERIKKRDAGSLTPAAAGEMIGEFLSLYKKIRYSPDELAEAPFTSAPGWIEGYYTMSGDPGIKEAEFSLLSFDLIGKYDSVKNSGQFPNFFDWFYPYMYFISADPKYYCGEIELYDDNYTLADHIKIVSTDNDNALVEVTARKRDGSGEAVYTVSFAKSYEKWRITGGTLPDLIAPVNES